MDTDFLSGAELKTLASDEDTHKKQYEEAGSEFGSKGNE